MDVLVFNQQTDLALAVESVKPIVQFVLDQETQATDEVSVYFVSLEKIVALHQTYFNDHSPTDCITFPLDKEEAIGIHILGEIFICPKRALDFILDPKKWYREVTLYLVHGLLHLIGYDDIEEEAQKKMRKAEERLMVPLIRQKQLLSG